MPAVFIELFMPSPASAPIAEIMNHHRTEDVQFKVTGSATHVDRRRSHHLTAGMVITLRAVFVHFPGMIGLRLVSGLRFPDSQRGQEPASGHH